MFIYLTACVNVIIHHSYISVGFCKPTVFIPDIMMLHKCYFHACIAVLLWTFSLFSTGYVQDLYTYVWVGDFRLCDLSTQPSVTKGPPCSRANHLLPTASRILAPLSNNSPARQIHIHTLNHVCLTLLSAGAHTNLTMTQMLALKTVKALFLTGEYQAFIRIPSGRLFGSSDSLWLVYAIHWMV